jgi:RNA polymerase sigma-70 factor (ECF subfamily)
VEERGLEAAAFGPIFDAHHERIWRFLYQRGGRECADELAGEVFAAALANRGQYDPARGDVAGWLYGIAANQARAFVRRKGRGRRAVGRLASQVRAAADAEVDQPTERIEDRLSSTVDAARVLAALRRLPDPDQEILVLVVWQGLSYEQAAAALGVPVGTVRSRLSRARARLRELAELGDQVPVDTRTQEPR